jgi:hypothetical protein
MKTPSNRRKKPRKSIEIDMNKRGHVIAVAAQPFSVLRTLVTCHVIPSSKKPFCTSVLSCSLSSRVGAQSYSTGSDAQQASSRPKIVRQGAWLNRLLTVTKRWQDGVAVVLQKAGLSNAFTAHRFSSIVVTSTATKKRHHPSLCANAVAQTDCTVAATAP